MGIVIVLGTNVENRTWKIVGAPVQWWLDKLDIFQTLSILVLSYARVCHGWTKHGHIPYIDIIKSICGLSVDQILICTSRICPGYVLVLGVD